MSDRTTRLSLWRHPQMGIILETAGPKGATREYEPTEKQAIAAVKKFLREKE